MQKSKIKNQNPGYFGFFFAILIFEFCALNPLCYASDIQFEAAVDRPTVSLGGSLQLSLSFYGTQNVSAPDIGKINGFQVSYLGPSTRMSIVNGQVSSSIIHIYTLTPLKTGKFKIGPFSVVFDSKTYTAKEMIVEVVSGPSPPAPGAQQSGQVQEAVSEEQLKDRILLIIEAGKLKPYLNEAIPLSIRLYIDRLSVRDIQYPKLEHEGLSIKEFAQPKQYRQNLGGVVYDVVEFDTVVFAVKPGALSLGPAKLDCSLVVRSPQAGRRQSAFGGFFDDSIFDDFFGRYETYAFQVKSPSLTVNVQPLPEEGRPDGFKGAIGNFSLEVEAAPAEVKAGDPITLKMRVSGRGNFDTVNAPVLDSEEGFKVYQPQAKQEGDAKIFEQVLIPQSEGVEEIPGIVFSFFDPELKEYRILTKGPFPVSVARAEGNELRIVEMPQAVMRTPKEESLGRDIVYIKESPGELKQKDSYFYQSAGFRLYYPVALVIFTVLGAFRRHKEKLKTDKRYARRLQAPAKARKGILQAQKLLTQEKSGEFFDLIHKTLTGYLADKFHLPAGGVTIDRVKEILSAKNIDGAIAEQLAGIFSACDMARYAPLEFNKSKQEDVFNDTRRVIDCLERKKI